jgi:hypothetical protein
MGAALDTVIANPPRLQYYVNFMSSRGKSVAEITSIPRIDAKELFEYVAASSDVKFFRNLIKPCTACSVE